MKFPIGGGQDNSIQDVNYETIAGGVLNTIQSGTAFGTVGGGDGAATWVNSSDVAFKESFQRVNPADVLNAVALLPVSMWNYRSEGAAARNIGPTAQDFQKAFQPNTDDKSIATVDAGGVALAAIQGLNQKLEQKETEITELNQRLDALEQLVRNQTSN